MDVVIIEAPTFKEIMSKVEMFVDKAEALCKNNSDKSLQKWLDNQDVCEILNISKRTLQTYRKNKLLPYSQIRHKVFYKPEDVDALLKSSYQPNTAER